MHACIHTYLRWVTNGTRSGFGHQGLDAWLELLLAATTAYGCISGARVLLSTGAALLLAREEDPAFFLRSLSRDSGAGRGWGGCVRFGWAAVEIACLAGVLLGEYSMFWLYLGRLLVLPQGAGGGRVERSPVSTRMCACMHSVCVRAFACIHVCVHAHAHTHTHTCTHVHTHTRTHAQTQELKPLLQAALVVYPVVAFAYVHVSCQRLFRRTSLQPSPRKRL